MKIRFIFLLSLSLLWACQAETQKETTQATETETAMKMSYHGEKIDAQNAVAVSELPEMMKGKELVEGLKLEGDITAACVKKGCWMKTKMDGDESLHITFKDYGFFVPTDAAGKKAIFEGKAYYDTTDVETLRHYAVDGGMSEEEAEKTITEPKYSLAFEATGVIIQDEGK